MRKFLTLLFIAFLSFSINGQERYMDQVFDEVKVTSDQIYGANATIITLLVPEIAEALRLEQLYDVYEPEGDTVDVRPCVFLFKTGNFLPIVSNGQVSGTKSDSALVEIARRLAKMGYVAISADYREGWNPIQPNQPLRALQLIQAAYRGVQDARTVVRHTKQLAAAGNPFRVDTTKLVLWGIGTGGYITLASSTLDEFTDIVQTTHPAGKFLTDLDGDGTADPMVIPSVNGDLEGTVYGVVPPTGLLIFPPNDTLCYPNAVGPSSEIQLCVNMGGAMGDISWLDSTDVPFISFHVPKDENAPYTDDVLRVPTTGDDIVQVQGSFTVVKKATELGLNSVFSSVPEDEITAAAKAAAAQAGNEYYEGLYAFNIDTVAGVIDGSPWDWWEPEVWKNFDNPFLPGVNMDQTARAGNPEASPERGRLYIDTIMAYYAPRGYAALGLGITSNVQQINEAEVGLYIAPNPVDVEFTVRVNRNNPIQSARFYNLSGHEIGRWNHINNYEIRANRNRLPSGIYVLQLYFEKGTISKKIVFK